MLAVLAAPVGAAVGHGIRWVPAVGHAHPSAPVSLTVNLTDAPSYSPQFLRVPQNSSVAITLTNQGTYTHTFTLVAQSGVLLNASWNPTQVYGFFQANGSLTNTSVAPGGSATVNLTFGPTSVPESFEFVSIVPYQFQAGMWGLLNVTAAGPALTLYENTTNAGGSVAFVPNALAASPTSYPVTLDVFLTNLGALGHTFTVVPTPGLNLTPQNFTTYLGAHTPLTNATIAASSGATVWANFSVPGPGVYQYICVVAGHFAAGMYGYLYVGVPPPAAPTPPSTAIVQEWVLVGSAALLGVGVVLLVGAAFSGRFG